MHRVTIESLAIGGFGFTRINGMSCFIPYALPGDEALIEVTDQSRGVNWGKLLEIYEPSPHRFEPICTVFEKCGGCQWLHFDYDEQIRWKSKLAEGALNRIGKIQDVKIEEIRSGIRMFGYRTRVRFHFKYVDDELLFGFHPPKSREVIDLKICPLIFGGINDLIYPIRHSLSKIAPLKFTGALEVTQNPKNSETLIWL
ncbi:TRAM domain-containing protein, partial [bacterium]|nr:TRAM domain-containing protein [bacterium]MBU1025643.1 TRAM domain-containing protein [bacterium]